jgi:cell division initiation protein
MLTPEDVLKVKFPTTRLKEGYDCEEVDKFLQMVRSTLTTHKEALAETERVATSLQEQVDTLKLQRDSLQAQLDSNPPEEQKVSSVVRILEKAQDMADETEREAQDRAQVVVQEAEDKAKALIREARAKTTVMEADAMDRVQELERELDELQKQRTTSLVSLQKLLDDLRNSLPAE